MLAPEWSEPTLGALLTALPRTRASTVGESAVTAAAWLLSGREFRFSTRGSLLDQARFLFAATR
jgi:hypothetical protein